MALIPHGKSLLDEPWWSDWPRDWPNPNEVMKKFWDHHPGWNDDWWTSDRWMDWPVWKGDFAPRWAEPVFAGGLNVKARVVNDQERFGVDIDAYQFRPEEIRVKTVDDTLIIEGRHEDVKDSENFTRMNFIRKYQLPDDVDAMAITSSMDGQGRLSVTAPKKYRPAVQGRERTIAIEAPPPRSGSGLSQQHHHQRSGSRASNQSHRSRHDSGTGSLKNGHADVMNGRQSRDENSRTSRIGGGGGSDYERGFDGGYRTESRSSSSRSTAIMRREYQ